MGDVKWIKMDLDIFNNRKIRQIEILPDGDAIIVIWVKLLCLAGNINDGGAIYLTSEIPYTDQMLATQFNRPLPTVQLALRTFEQFGMIEVVDNILHISNWEKYQNIDRLNEIREYNRLAQQKSRAKKRMLLDVNDMSMTNQSCHETDKSREDKKRIDKSREDKKEDKNSKEGKPPVVYFPEDSKLNDSFLDYIKMRKQIKAPMTERAIELAINKLEALSGGDNDKAIEILEQSIMNSWKGLFELKDSKTNTRGNSQIDAIMNA